MMFSEIRTNNIKQVKNCDIKLVSLKQAKNSLKDVQLEGLVSTIPY